MQWIGLAGLAALGVLAVFVFGIGQSEPSNPLQHQGMTNEIAVFGELG